MAASQLRASDPFHPFVLKYVIRFGALINGALAIGFGLQLLRSGDTFSTSATFNVLAARFSEHDWGLWMVVCGVIQVFAHWLPLAPLWRLPIAFKWGYMGFVFLVASPISTGGVTYLGLGVMGLVLVALDGARFWFERRRYANS